MSRLRSEVMGLRKPSSPCERRCPVVGIDLNAAYRGAQFFEGISRVVTLYGAWQENHSP
ncbi:hypothetical protein AB9Q10_45545 [Streptomyces krungchingensis]|uniref:hypothetical protein n=1 Tax=Streptomyces krungchingensis TaxID=1565034 RepID=UPI003CE935F7